MHCKTEYGTAGMCGFTFFRALTEPNDQSQEDIQKTELRKHCSFPILMCKVSTEEEHPAGKTCVSRPYWAAMISQLQSNRELKKLSRDQQVSCCDCHPCRPGFNASSTWEPLGFKPPLLSKVAGQLDAQELAGMHAQHATC